jgi:hypothetical protein
MNNILVPANFPATTIQTKRLYVNTATSLIHNQQPLFTNSTKQLQMFQQTQNTQDDLDFVLHYDDVKVSSSNKQQQPQQQYHLQPPQRQSHYQLQQPHQVQFNHEQNMIMDDFDFNLTDFSSNSNINDNNKKSNMQQIPISNLPNDKSSPQSFYR